MAFMGVRPGDIVRMRARPITSAAKVP
jgi:hypothetical protein